MLKNYMFALDFIKAQSWISREEKIQTTRANLKAYYMPSLCSKMDMFFTPLGKGVKVWNENTTLLADHTDVQKFN